MTKKYQILSLLTPALLLGCKLPNLMPLSGLLDPHVTYLSVDSTFCTAPPKVIQQKVKYLFLVDGSAPNANYIPPPPLSGAAPADPIPGIDVAPPGVLRYAPIVSFLLDIASSSHSSSAYASFIPFNDSANIPSAFPQNKFMSASDPALLDTVRGVWIGSGSPFFPSPVDGGNSNYSNALAAAVSLISLDLQHEQQTQSVPYVESIYEILFISGVPDISGLTSATVVANLSNITNNAALAPFLGGIYLNTFCYYPETVPGSPPPAPNPAAVADLTMMASSGNGQFIAYNASDQISYSSMIPPLPSLKYILADVFVENENAVWWDNHQYMVDTDRDGLPDTIEKILGSNSLEADTDSNGVSDLVEYRSSGSATQTPSNDFHICDGFRNSGSDAIFNSSANDGLNDCEKFVLADFSPDQFNIPETFIPIAYGFKNGLSIQSPLGSINGQGQIFGDPFGDGITNYQRLKSGFPIATPGKSIIGFSGRDIVLEHLASSNATSDCYHMVIDNFAVLGDNNSVKIYVVQNTAVLQDKPILKIAQKKFIGHNSPLVFSPEDFQ